MIRHFNCILYGFARKINRVSRTDSQGIPGIDTVANKFDMRRAQNQQIQEQFDQEIEPLSYDRQVQESLKAKVAETLKYNYEGEDPSPHKLVHRPSKGAAWGLGGQLMLASKKVQLEGLKA